MGLLCHAFWPHGDLKAWAGVCPRADVKEDPAKSGLSGT